MKEAPLWSWDGPLSMPNIMLSVDIDPAPTQKLHVPKASVLSLDGLPSLLAAAESGQQICVERAECLVGVGSWLCSDPHWSQHIQGQFRRL